MLKIATLATALVMFAPLAFAQSGGTPQDRADCSPDVRKYCQRVDPQSGDMGYLSCLQQVRAQGKLSARCGVVLQKYGQ